jgi:hypothetical protein
MCNRLQCYVAPSLLLAVAGLQMLLAGTASLSPWKGGGFGMFSTVDAPSARFLRVYLITGGREIPVLLPDQLRPLAAEIKTMPRARRLRDLACKVASGTWVPYRLSPAVHHYRHLLSSVDGNLPGSWSDGWSDTNTGSAGQLSIAQDISFERITFLRMLADREPIPGNVVLFQRVRVELWRYRYLLSESRLTARREASVLVPRGDMIQ